MQCEVLTAYPLRMQGKAEGSIGKALLQQVLLPIALSAGMVAYVLKNGKKLVNRPLLRPDLSQPW